MECQGSAVEQWQSTQKEGQGPHKVGGGQTSSPPPLHHPGCRLHQHGHKQR